MKTQSIFTINRKKANSIPLPKWIDSTEKLNFRILSHDFKILHVGNSWMTLEQAKKLVDYSKGQMIYEYNDKNERLWEIL